MDTPRPITLIADTNATWRAFETARVINSWGYPVTPIDDPAVLLAEPLIPPSASYLLSVSTPQAIKAALAVFADIDDWARVQQTGLIIVANTASGREGTRKKPSPLVTFFTGQHIPVELHLGNGRYYHDRTHVAQLVASLRVTPDVRAALLDAAGGDATVIAPLVDQLAALPPDQQARVKPVQIATKVHRQGDDVPWRLVEAITTGRASQVADITRRAVANGSLQQALGFVRDRVYTAYMFALATQLTGTGTGGVASLAQMQQALQRTGPGTNHDRFAYQLAATHGAGVLAQAVRLLDQVRPARRLPKQMLADHAQSILEQTALLFTPTRT